MSGWFLGNHPVNFQLSEKEYYGAAQMSFGIRSLSISLFLGYLYLQFVSNHLSQPFYVSLFTSVILINKEPTKLMVSELNSVFQILISKCVGFGYIPIFIYTNPYFFLTVHTERYKSLLLV